MDELDIQILEILARKEIIASNELALMFSVSSRTIRNRLKHISEILIEDIAVIKSKPGIGFSLEIKSEKKFDNFINDNKKFNNSNPQSKEGRINLIIDYLLLNEDYVNLTKMSELLFVSRSTLSHDLLEVRSYFSRFQLEVEDFKNKGVKLVGKEKDIRRCMSQKNDNKNLFDLFGGHERYIKITKLLKSILDKYSIGLSDLSFQNLCNHLYILVERNKSKNYQKESEFKNVDLTLYNQLIDASKEIVFEVNNIFNIELSSSEVIYVAIHLGGKQCLSSSKNNSEFFTEKNTDELVIKFLEAIYYDWNIDLRKDEQLIFNLTLHFKPMIIRLLSGFDQINPMLEDIKCHLPFAYLLTAQSIHVVENTLKMKMTEDEISFISLHINLSLKRKIENKNKKNILILCDTGMTSSKMLASIITDRFSRYINNIDTGQINNITKIDLTPFDLLISTKEFNLEVNIPKVQVNYFLDERDIEKLNKYLIPSTYKPISNYFEENLFLRLESVDNKEEIISKIVDKIVQIHDVPESFLASILERESTGSTDFSNLIALPHPREMLTDKSIVSVAILDKAIKWNTEKVQVVLLVSVQRMFSSELNLFYKVMSKFISSQDEVSKLIKHRNYDKFINQIKDIEKSISIVDNKY